MFLNATRSVSERRERNEGKAVSICGECHREFLVCHCEEHRLKVENEELIAALREHNCKLLEHDFIRNGEVRELQTKLADCEKKLAVATEALEVVLSNNPNEKWVYGLNEVCENALKKIREQCND